jgi:hypothetical protein
VSEPALKDNIWGERQSATEGSAPDLHSQFEDILDSVWKAEANWAFDDRLNVAVRASAAAAAAGARR